MLARLSKTLSTNVAIAGLSLVVLGAGGTSASLAAGNSPTPKPDKTRTTSEDAKEKAEEDATEKAEAKAEDTGTRPTDTHGYCVSQIAKTAPTQPTGEGTDKVTHGTLVSAAAHACGKDKDAAREARAAAKAARTAAKAVAGHGKAYGKNHGTGRPAAVTPGASTGS